MFQNCSKYSSIRGVSGISHSDSSQSIPSTGGSTGGSTDGSTGGNATDFWQKPTQNVPIDNYATSPNFYRGTVAINATDPDHIMRVFEGKNPILNFFPYSSIAYPGGLFQDHPNDFLKENGDFIPFVMSTHCMFPGEDKYINGIDKYMSKDSSGNYKIMKIVPKIHYKLLDSAGNTVIEVYDEYGGLENKYRNMDLAYAFRKWIKKGSYVLHIKNISDVNSNVRLNLNVYSAPTFNYNYTVLQTINLTPGQSTQYNLTVDRYNNESDRFIKVKCYAFDG